MQGISALPMTTPPIAEILFHSASDDGSMLAAFREALPEHRLITDPHKAKPQAVEHAIVWQPPADFFDGFDRLRYVHALAAGVDQLMTHPGLPPDATVLRLEDAGMGVLMAEYVLYGVLHAHRGLPALQAAAERREWLHQLGVPAAAAVRVGILGAGALGTIVAERLAANGYSVCCWSRSEKTLPAPIEHVAGETHLRDFLNTSDVLVCLLPLTEATRGILDARLFNALPDGAFVINVARGGHLVEADLLDAITRDKLAGALLDVFDEEPLPDDHPFWSEPRILVTPHIAAPSPVPDSVARITANIARIRAGETPIGMVDRSRGY
ncbi:MAG: glyoxylate/hydroxypyruvate reductase A [Gammaproteobacteria bacterium]|nr:MAG: glyoxylate/hydroxypyruvate reductase A [Gammaproteobacteria bacterium]